MRLPPVVPRLLLPAGMVMFLLLTLAYWWLDNLPHEIFGTGLFVLLAWHVVRNWFWFRTMFKGPYRAHRLLVLGMHLVLIANMIALLATSLLISRAVFAFLPVADSPIIREVHMFAAYWVMIIVGIHLGLHWARVMAVVRATLRLSPANAVRTWCLRVGVACLGAYGIASWQILGVWTKLTFGVSLDFWDFSASVSPFFGHWIGVLSLPAIAFHYMRASLQRAGRSAAA
jgi:hypothetical protein